MKITGFINNLSKGGAQGVFVSLMNYFKEKDFDVDIVVQNMDDAIHLSELNDEIRITSLECHSAKAALTRVIRFVKNNNIENAWVFGPELTVDLILARRVLRKEFHIYGRSVNTISEEFKRTSSLFRKCVTGTLIKLFYSKADHIVAQCDQMRMDLIDNFGFKEAQVTTILNPLAKKYEDEIEHLETTKREDFILFAGRLEEQKGIKLLLTSFSQMMNQHTKLYIIGDGSQRQELIEMAKQLNLKERVEFYPYTEHIIDYYRKARCVALTSYYEGFPNVLIESLACGTPIVSFNTPSGPDVIISKENGILVEYLNIEKMTVALDDALQREWNHGLIKESARRFTSVHILSNYLTIMNGR